MKYQDIQIDDVYLQKQYIELWMDGNYSEALKLLNTNPQLDLKKFIAKCMSTIGTSLIILEQNYFVNFPDFLQLELVRFNKTINDFIYRADWNNSTNYSVGNSVIYNQKIYFCIQDNVKVSPTNQNYWIQLHLIGNKGNYGISGRIRYTWSSKTQYNKNDIVYFDEYLWMANFSNQDERPKKDSTFWSKLIEVPRAKVVVSSIPPQKKYDGLIWAKIFN